MTALMERRRAATEQTKRFFLGTPFVWGSFDCATMADAHLRAMGHNARFQRAGAYTSAIGAKKAFLRCGYRGVIDWMNDVRTIEPINWARAIVGDLAAFRYDYEGIEWHALGVVLGGQRVLMFHSDAEHEACAAVAVSAIPDACWRVRPCLP